MRKILVIIFVVSFFLCMEGREGYAKVGQEICYGGEVQYVIQPGDTLTSISKMTGVSVEKLVSYNNIKDPNMIYSGRMINLINMGVTGDSRRVKKFLKRMMAEVGEFIRNNPSYIRYLLLPVSEETSSRNLPGVSDAPPAPLFPLDLGGPFSSTPPTSPVR